MFIKIEFFSFLMFENFRIEHGRPDGKARTNKVGREFSRPTLFVWA